MIKYTIKPGYQHLFNNISDDFHKWFNENGETIYKIRNEVKIIKHNNELLCIKSFQRPNIVNTIVYSFFRPSKAKRSYLYASKLTDAKIKTPEPVAFIEFYNRYGFIDKSYFISKYYKHSFSMDAVLKKKEFNNDKKRREEIIEKLTTYIYQNLHSKGILHLDLGGNNILVDNSSDKLEFSLIDLNRIKFKKRLSFKTKVKNMSRLQGGVYELAVIAQTYGNLAKADEVEVIEQLAKNKNRLKRFRKFKRKYLKPFKGLITRK
ncbi:lipopolysaccharide kinase InaA family protein [Marinilabiliaceae bacterium ANBcel2]|nr:lipopolysaccharide kinase InaA family protein [Marinilabiliaceae bacterium ANBcel2]